MFAKIKLDIKRFVDNAYKVNPDNRSKLKTVQLLLFSPGLHSIVIYRFGRYAQQQISPLKLVLVPLHYILEKLIVLFYGIHLSVQADIGESFYIGHLGGIKVGQCKIGKNCSIYQRVVIDSNREGMPIIGDRGWIGAHSHVIGPIKIEEGATVSAGSIVKEDLPSNCLVAGGPARVIKLDFDNSAIH